MLARQRQRLYLDILDIRLRLRLEPSRSSRSSKQAMPDHSRARPSHFFVVTHDALSSIVDSCPNSVSSFLFNTRSQVLTFRDISSSISAPLHRLGNEFNYLLSPPRSLFHSKAFTFSKPELDIIHRYPSSTVSLPSYVCPLRITDPLRVPRPSVRR
jgi:hypothetical protein